MIKGIVMVFWKIEFIILYFLFWEGNSYLILVLIKRNSKYILYFNDVLCLDCKIICFILIWNIVYLIIICKIFI